MSSNDVCLSELKNEKQCLLPKKASNQDFNPFISKTNYHQHFDLAQIIDDKDEALRSMDDLECEEDESEEQVNFNDDSLLVIISCRTDHSEIALPIY